MSDDYAAPIAPADWYPDPAARHQYRYWDGATWTDHVADAGVLATDPLPPRPQATKVALTVGRFAFGIVGEASYQAALRRISGGRREQGQEVDFVALVRREPDNEYDSNAVRVIVNGVGTVGYFRRDDAAAAQPGLLAIEARGEALECPARLIGGEHGRRLGVILDLDFERLRNQPSNSDQPRRT